MVDDRASVPFQSIVVDMPRFDLPPLASVPLLLAPLAAQDHPPAVPPSAATQVVVVSPEGLPRPGVPLLYLDSARLNDPVADGWARPDDPRARELALAQAVWTDPEGKAKLPPGPPTRLLRVGAPYLWGSADSVDGVLRVKVTQQELFTVRLLDAQGQRVAGATLALRAGNRDESIARTDSTGLALLGLAPEFAARLIVAPFGWVGARDAFPTVSTVQQRARAELQLPPYGSVRLRALRQGVPVRVERAECHLIEPSSVSVWHGPGTVWGIELPYVALDQTLRGYATLGERRLAFRQAGPTRAGECVVIDVELAQAEAEAAAARQAAVATPAATAPQVSVPMGDVSARLDVPLEDLLVLRVGLVARLPAAGAKASYAVPRQPTQQQAVDGGVELGFGNVPAGSYSLVIMAPLSRDELLRVDGLEVTAQGCADPRLRALRVAELLQVLTVRVADHRGVPLAGAQFELRTPYERLKPMVGREVAPFQPQLTLARATDGQGVARIVIARGVKFNALLSAERQRPLDIPALDDGAALRMEPAAVVGVSVKGLPDDLAREGLEVNLRPAAIGRFELMTTAPLGAGDCADVPLPARGRYLVEFTAVQHSPTGKRGTVISRGAEFDLGDPPAAPLELTLAPAEVERLRTELVRPKR